MGENELILAPRWPFDVKETLVIAVVMTMFIISFKPTHVGITYDCGGCDRKGFVGNLPIPSGSSKLYRFDCSCGFVNGIIIYFDGQIFVNGEEFH